jgi:hypothetical protein
MKTMTLLLVVLSFPFLAFSQSSKNFTTEEVSVLYANFVKKNNQNLQLFYGTIPYYDREPTSHLSGNSFISLQYRRELESIKPGNLNRAEVAFRNNTQKQIESIEYSFIVISKEDGKEVKRYSFVSNSKLKANSMKTISSDLPGNFLRTAFVFKAQITRVKYNDGSFWIP